MKNREEGFLLMEALVIISLFGLLALVAAHTVIFSYRMRHKAAHNSAAMQLAMEELESLASVDPSTLDASDNFNDTIKRDHMSFNRSVNFTVNSDNSRTVLVTISDNDTKNGGKATLSSTFATWGSQ